MNQKITHKFALFFKQTIPLLFVLLASLSLEAQTTRYVKPTASGSGDGSSWANASASLQAMINASASGDAVWVAAGTYKPTAAPTGCTNCANARNYTFYVKAGVKIYGGFAGTETALSQRSIRTNVTILSGDIGTANVATDNCLHVVLTATTGAGVTVDGFTIKDGYANPITPTVTSMVIDGNTIRQDQGGGIYTVFGTNTISNNTIYNNFARKYGGGMYCEKSTNTISNNIIYDNKILNANVTSNGGGIYLYGNDAGTIFTYNVFNNVLYGNTADGGGGIYAGYTNSTVTNNTFYNNRGDLGGGGFRSAFGGTCTLRNNIFRANTNGTNANIAESDIRNFNNTMTVTHCLTQQNSTYATGTGIINNQDPLFTNAAAGNFTLQSTSPCINAGTLTGAPTTDITGATRSGNPDLGAYEYVAVVSDVITISNVSPTQPTCPSARGSISITASSSQSSTLEYSVDNGTNWQASNTFNNLVASAYNIKVRVQSNTSNIATYGSNPVTLNAAPNCFSGTTTSTVNTTCGNSNGQAVITVSGGTAPYIVNGTSYNTNPFTITGLATNTYNFTVTENGGGSTVVNAVVNATADNIPPSVTTQNITVQLAANGSVTITPAQVNNGSSDNCTSNANLNLSLSKTTFNCSNIGANTVTLTVRDAANNSNTGTATVTVQQGAATCFSGTTTSTVNAGCGSSNGQAVITVSGGTAPYIVNGTSYNTNPFTITGLAANTYNFTVTENGGLSTVVNATIGTASDNTPPSVVTQNITVQLAANGSVTITPAQVNNGSSDNCTSNANLNLSLSKTTFNCSNIGANTVTLTVRDAANNSNIGTATVTVQQGAATCFSGTTTSTVNTTCGSSNGQAVITVSGGTAPYTVNGTSYNTNPFTITGLAANTYNFTVTENGVLSTVVNATVGATADNVPPSVTTRNIIVPLNASGNATITPAQINNGSSDNCTSNANLTLGLSQTAFTCANIGANTVTLTVTDAAGNSNTGTATVTIQDTTRPIVITRNITVPLNASGNATITPAQINNSSSDNCSVANLALSQTAFTCANIGVNTVTLTVTDAAGNSNTGTATVTIQDTTRPIVITRNITVPLNASGNATITPAQINNSSSDNCSVANLALSQTAFTCANIGANTVTLTVTDAAGNTNTGTATVTIQDTTRPIVITRNITVPLNASGNATITPAQINNSSSDNCSVANLALSQTAFTCANIGANTVTLTVTDAAGNSNTGTATVTIQDTTRPIVITRNITIPLNASGNATITPAQINNSSSDNCSVANLALSQTAFTCANIGANTVTLTVTDAAGNSNTGTATVTIQDTTRPIVITRNITVPLNASGNATITPAQINNGSSDNCSVANLALSQTAFTCANIGVNTVTLTVTDAAGNTNTGTATVTIQDTTRPIVITRNITVPLNASGNATITPAQINNGSSDNCTSNANLTLALSQTAFTCSNIGANTVTLTVTDAAGNSNTGTATVTIQDTTRPIVITRNITVPLNASGNATITPAQINNGSSDNCSVANLALSQTAFTCANIGVNTVTLTVTDAAGNSNTGTATVTIQDTTRPIVITRNITVPLDATGNVTITPAQVNNGSSDNCTNILLRINRAAFTCANIGANTVILTVTDANGNVNTGTATVTVSDVTPPSVVTRNITIQLNANGNASITPAQINNGSFDNCTNSNNLTLSLSKTNFSCADLGTNTITLTAVDANGNRGTNTAIVTVEDKIKPTLVCKDYKWSFDATGVLNITPNDLIQTISDNCELTTTISQSRFDVQHIGENSILVQTSDRAGNISNCRSIVNVAFDCIPKDAVLTPNEDGKNDTWEAPCVRSLQTSFLIYNRYGQSVYDAPIFNGRWDGRNQDGQELPQGGYYYIMKVNLGGRVQTFTGSVVVLRR